MEQLRDLDPPLVSVHRCIHCKQEKAGRFTKSKLAAGGGWSQQMHVGSWCCWDCLPRGHGRGE